MEEKTRIIPIEAVPNEPFKVDFHGEPLAELMDRNFLDYASYVICERAIPSLSDGLKPVQRRILHSMNEMDDGRFIKVANVIGNTMQYHPHGDASIGAALVNLANRSCLIDKQGNFGNTFTGDPAAAPRYIECRLTNMARDQLFNKNITEYVPSYDGRNMEPVEFPCKLPLLLMMGTEGIAVGMSTRILPHNLGELLDAQIALVSGKQVKLLPDFIQGGLMDVAEYDEGRGTVRLRARIEDREDGSLYITEIPFSTNTDSLVASIDDAVRARKLPISSINNYTAETVNIELVLKSEADTETLISKLYAFTQCDVVLNSSIIVLKDKKPVVLKAHELLHENTKQLFKVLKKELQFQKHAALEAIQARTLQRIFIEEKVYQVLEYCLAKDDISRLTKTRMERYKAEFLRDITDADIQTLLSIRIRQISGYDMDKNLRVIKKINKDLEQINWRLDNMKRHVLKTLRDMKKQYCPETVRRTEITSFEQIKRKELTANEIKMSFNSETGYVGSKIDGDRSIECSPYDKIVLIWNNGRCKVIRPCEKLFTDVNLVYFAKVDAKRILTIVYSQDGFSYLKRFKFSGAVQNKIYRCAPRNAKIMFSSDQEHEKLYVKYQPYDGMQIAQQYFEPSGLPVQKVQSAGKQMTSKVIDKIATEMPKWWDEEAKAPRGVFMDMI